MEDGSNTTAVNGMRLSPIKIGTISSVVNPNGVASTVSKIKTKIILRFPFSSDLRIQITYDPKMATENKDKLISRTKKGKLIEYANWFPYCVCIKLTSPEKMQIKHITAMINGAVLIMVFAALFLISAKLDINISHIGKSIQPAANPRAQDIRVRAS
jgi:hypothetical protein